MISQLPDPPVPCEVDLRDFHFTPIFRNRLLGSRFHAQVSDAGWRAGVTLWLRSWDQVPAGSPPDGDVDLCRLAELGRDMQAWRKIREEALWGWIKCADGRLYHKVVAEGVMEAWKRKCAQRERTELARKACAAKRQSHTTEKRDDPSVTDTVTDSKKQGQGQGQRYISTPPSLRSGGCPPPLCEQVVEKPPDDQPPLALEATGPDELERAFSDYNATAERAGLPKALKFDAARKAKLRQRLKDCGGLSGWVAALARLEASAMCCGDNNRGWRADLDFLLQSQSFTRLMEGRYDNRPTAGSSHAEQRYQTSPDAPGKRDQRARKAAFFAGAARAFGG